MLATALLVDLRAELHSRLMIFVPKHQGTGSMISPLLLANLQASAHLRNLLVVVERQTGRVPCRKRTNPSPASWVERIESGVVTLRCDNGPISPRLIKKPEASPAFFAQRESRSRPSFKIHQLKSRTIMEESKPRSDIVLVIHNVERCDIDMTRLGWAGSRNCQHRQQGQADDCAESVLRLKALNSALDFRESRGNKHFSLISIV